MKIHQKVLVSLLIFFFSGYMLSRPVYAMKTPPTFEEFVEKIKNTNKQTGTLGYLNIPDNQTLETLDSNGNNILHITVQHNNCLILKYLTQEPQICKKFYKLKNSTGQTPLRLALDLTHLKCAEHLSTFYDDNPADQNKTTTLHAATQKEVNFENQSEIKKIILNIIRQVDSNTTDYEIMKKILNRQDIKGNTPFHLIYQNKTLTEAARNELIKDYLGDIDIYLQNHEHKSILDYAALCPSEEIKKMFKNMDLELPFKLAVLKNSLELLKLKLTTLQSSLKKLQTSLVKV